MNNPDGSRDRLRHWVARCVRGVLCVALTCIALLGCETTRGRTHLSPAEEARFGEAYSLAAVKQMVLQGRNTADILDTLRNNCVAFEVDDYAIQQLLGAGADSSLTIGLKGICVVTRETFIRRSAKPNVAEQEMLWYALGLLAGTVFVFAISK